jgi:hypothetical protein
MASTINASSLGIVETADSTGILQLQTNGTAGLNLDTSQNVQVINNLSVGGSASFSTLTVSGNITSTSGYLIETDGGAYSALQANSVTMGNVQTGLFYNGSNGIGLQVNNTPVFGFFQNGNFDWGGTYSIPAPAGSTSTFLRNDGTWANAITGVTNGSTAGAGYVGQVITANQSTPVSATAGADTVVTSITLTPGDWDVTSLGNGYSSAGNDYIDFITATSTTTSIGNSVGFYGANPNPGTDTAASFNYFANYNVTTNTTVYLLVRMNGGSGTGFTASGSIFARRMR